MGGRVRKPTMRIMALTTKPAIGPAAPMSNVALLEGISDRTLITAPSVPNGNKPRKEGKGRKYGSVADTL